MSSNSSATPMVEISPGDHGTIPLSGSFETSSQREGGSRIDAKLLRALKDENWKHPTPIQANSIPLLAKGYDVMASSHTGSGKSLMFSLPMVQRILNHPSERHQQNTVMGLVISPTRELAMQTSQVLKSICRYYPQIKISLATGGGNTKQQRQQLSSATIVVGTPGRILQFTDERTSLSLRNIQFLVIDEADRLMDLGFEPQLNRIARLLQGKNQPHQSVLCSATFPPSVQRLAADFLKPEYYFVSVGKVGSTQARIRQQFEWVPSATKGGSDGKTKAVIRNVKQTWKSMARRCPAVLSGSG
eukprot:scaffold9673_cov108-Cylindrotheca_fusiformis.AAC.2